MKKRVMGMAVLAGFVFSILMVTGAFAQKDEITFDVSYGKVKFTHKKHADTLQIDCLKCHHTWKKGETSGKLCKDCHKELAADINTGRGLHGHIEKDKPCKDCHDPHAPVPPVVPGQCSACHAQIERTKAVSRSQPQRSCSG